MVPPRSTNIRVTVRVVLRDVCSGLLLSQRCQGGFCWCSCRNWSCCNRGRCGCWRRRTLHRPCLADRGCGLPRCIGLSNRSWWQGLCGSRRLASHGLMCLNSRHNLFELIYTADQCCCVMYRRNGASGERANRGWGYYRRLGWTPRGYRPCGGIYCGGCKRHLF